MDINKISFYYQKAIYNTSNKIIVIGDIHGDLKAFLTCLKKAKLIDNNNKWIGGNTNVVQMGDILDRKIRTSYISDEDSEFIIINIIKRLQIESYLSGGSFHCLIGNHELMNIMGIFDYVSKLGIKHFGSLNERYNNLRPGTKFTKYLACFWNPIIKINNFLFVHGGINNNISNNYSIKTINYMMKKYLMGDMNYFNNNHFKILFLNDNSLLWNRDFSNNFFDKNILKNILNNYGCKSLIVGHTPQEHGINQFNNGLVWRVDTGMSESFGPNNFRRIQILEIQYLKNIDNYLYKII